MAKNPPKPAPKPPPPPPKPAPKPPPPPAPKPPPPPAPKPPPPPAPKPPPPPAPAPTPISVSTPTPAPTPPPPPPPPPPPNNATEEQRRIDKVNELRQAGKLTQNEAEELRQLARSMSNNKGNLSEDEERYFTQQLNRALDSNIKGNIPPPKTGGGGNNNGGGGPDKPPGGGGPDKPPGGGGPDKPPGGGGPDKPPGGGVIQPPPVLDDGKFNQKDIDAILRLINELQGDVKKLKEENKTLKNELDLISELAVDGGGGKGGGEEDDSVEDDATSAASDVPTTRSATGTIDANIPKTNFGADISYPKDAERIWMPNIDTKVKKEVERITMSLIKSTREFLEAGIDYDGINQVPANSGFQGDLLYTDPLENNQSESNESALASEILLGVTDILTKEFAKSDPNSTNYYYIRFLEFFELNYNASGEPYYDLNININNDIIESLKAIVVKVDEDGIETRVAEGE